MGASSYLSKADFVHLGKVILLLLRRSSDPHTPDNACTVRQDIKESRIEFAYDAQMELKGHAESIRFISGLPDEIL